jgi:tetratricopeptide (TPR) repeat protein
LALGLLSLAALVVATGRGTSPEARADVRACQSLEAAEDESLAACRRALARGLPADWSSAVRVTLARRLSALGLWEEVAFLYREESDAYPESGQGPLRLGSTLLLGLARPEEAESALREALRREPRLAMAEALLGTALNALSRFSESTAAFDRAAGLDPELFGSRPALAEVRAASQTGERWP